MNDGTLAHVPEPFPVPIGLRLNQAARAVERAFDEALAEAGGTLPIWLILLNLKIRTPGNQRELAEAVGVREATLTHHLNTMDARGLITRTRDAANRRIQVVALTEAGEAAFLRLRDHRDRVRRPAAGRPLRHRCGPARRAPRPASRQRGVARRATPRPGPASPTARRRASRP